MSFSLSILVIVIFELDRILDLPGEGSLDIPMLDSMILLIDIRRAILIMGETIP